MLPPAFTIRISGTSDWCCVVPEGELDLATAPTLEFELDRLECWRPRVVVVDLRGVTFMDLPGIRLLLAADERARCRGGVFAVVRGSRIVQRLMQVLELDTTLNLIDDPAEIPPVRLLTAS